MSFFDPNTVEDSFSSIPAGTYRVIVDNVELKRNSKNTGDLISVTFKVAAGEFKGRQLWSNFNFTHQNKTAENIGRAQLKKFLAAIGVTGALSDEAAFHNAVKNRVLFVDAIEGDNGRNEVKDWIADAPQAVRPAQSHAQGYSDPGF